MSNLFILIFIFIYFCKKFLKSHVFCIRRQEEERLRQEEEEQRCMEEEQLRLQEEHRKQEEEKLRKAIEENERKEEEERVKREEEQRLVCFFFSSEIKLSIMKFAFFTQLQC